MHLVGSVLYGADEMVHRFVAERVPNTVMENYVALGVVRNGALVAGVVFQNYRKIDIEVVAAAANPSWAMPATLRRLFAYPFDQLGLVRITAIVGRKNKRSRRFAKALGFVEEGVCRRALDGREDAVIYGMLRHECRVLRKTHG